LTNNKNPLRFCKTEGVFIGANLIWLAIQSLARLNTGLVQKSIGEKSKGRSGETAEYHPERLYHLQGLYQQAKPANKYYSSGTLISLI